MTDADVILRHYTMVGMCTKTTTFSSAIATGRANGVREALKLAQAGRDKIELGPREFEFGPNPVRPAPGIEIYGQDAQATILKSASTEDVHPAFAGHSGVVYRDLTLECTAPDNQQSIVTGYIGARDVPNFAETFYKRVIIKAKLWGGLIWQTPKDPEYGFESVGLKLTFEDCDGYVQRWGFGVGRTGGNESAGYVTWRRGKVIGNFGTIFHIGEQCDGANPDRGGLKDRICAFFARGGTVNVSDCYMEMHGGEIVSRPVGFKHPEFVASVWTNDAPNHLNSQKEWPIVNLYNCHSRAFGPVRNGGFVGDINCEVGNVNVHAGTGSGPQGEWIRTEDFRPREDDGTDNEKK